MKKNNLLFILSLCTIVLFTQCKKDPEKCSTDDTESVRGCMDNTATNYNESADCDDNSCKYELTQERLDGSNSLVVSLTGPQHGMDFPHNGTMNPASTTIRDIFTSNGTVPDEISPGYLVTKHTYAADSLGNKGDLLVTFAMLKHDEGFWEDSNNWEYFSFPNNDPSVDFSVNPNGLLANAGVSGTGHNNCWGCHNGAQGNDQLFSND